MPSHCLFPRIINASPTNSMLRRSSHIFSYSILRTNLIWWQNIWFSSYVQPFNKHKIWVLFGFNDIIREHCNETTINNAMDEMCSSFTRSDAYILRGYRPLSVELRNIYALRSSMCNVSICGVTFVFMKYCVSTFSILYISMHV